MYRDHWEKWNCACPTSYKKNSVASKKNARSVRPVVVVLPPLAVTIVIITVVVITTTIPSSHFRYYGPRMRRILDHWVRQKPRPMPPFNRYHKKKWNDWRRYNGPWWNIDPSIIHQHPLLPIPILVIKRIIPNYHHHHRHHNNKRHPHCPSYCIRWKRLWWGWYGPHNWYSVS